MEAHPGVGASQKAGKAAARGPAPRRSLVVLAALAVVMLMAELGARALSPWFHDEFEGWGSAHVAAKAAQIDHVGQLGGADIVVTGTSQVHWGINGHVVANAMGTPGATVYNAALLGGTPLLQRQWLLDTVVPTLQPDIVVWGISPLDFAVDNPVMAGPAATFLSSRNGAPGLGHRIDRWLGERLALVRHRAELRSPATIVDAITRMRRDDAPRWLDGASLEGLTPSGSARPTLNRIMNWSQLEMDRTIELLGTGFEDAEHQRQAMIATIEALQAAGIDVVLAVMPMSRLSVGLQFGANGTLRAFYEAVAAIANATGAPVLDLQSSGTADGLFADAVHLNGNGAITFSRLLGLLLKDPTAEVDELKRELMELQGLDTETGLSPTAAPNVQTEPGVIAVLEGLGWRRSAAGAPLTPPPPILEELPDLVILPTPLLPDLEPLPDLPTGPVQPTVPEPDVPTIEVPPIPDEDPDLLEVLP